eukprot:TRINITY_DN5898_c0_g1_i1.p3 TRINITY_DN5898_c0_g1~~TRINITY_DN5898_c0_g1_i1.p3  ORF type:complete len:133 (-),score=11.39 TRINITY_DN5898_c0_g1_i1:571-969(-)
MHRETIAKLEKTTIPAILPHTPRSPKDVQRPRGCAEPQTASSASDLRQFDGTLGYKTLRPEGDNKAKIPSPEWKTSSSVYGKYSEAFCDSPRHARTNKFTRDLALSGNYRAQGFTTSHSKGVVTHNDRATWD